MKLAPFLSLKVSLLPCRHEACCPAGVVWYFLTQNINGTPEVLGILANCPCANCSQVLSSGIPEVCNYPFTTRSIKMGHFYLDGRKHQVGSCLPSSHAQRPLDSYKLLSSLVSLVGQCFAFTPSFYDNAVARLEIATALPCASYTHAYIHYDICCRSLTHLGSCPETMMSATRWSC